MGGRDKEKKKKKKKKGGGGGGGQHVLLVYACCHPLHSSSCTGKTKKKITLGKSQAEGKRKKGNKAELCIVLCRDFHKPVVD